jgi:PhzF family phenazine biosynthesis protein
VPQTVYQVDAFTQNVFAGNPAAICPLDSWLPDDTMQTIAAENNLAETAYFVPDGDGFHLRWFTPETEVDLCGHATLASAWVLYNKMGYDADGVTFHTLSGPLTVARQDDLLVMDFPARPPHPAEPCAGLLEALGGSPAAVLAARDYLVVYESAEEVRALKPEMMGLMNIDRFAVIATAPGDGERDCVSRFFAPAKGIAEDPVTGSAHCTIVPYWAERLGKPEIHAFQASRRGGDLFCRMNGDRVTIAGHCAFYMEGAIHL